MMMKMHASCAVLLCSMTVCCSLIPAIIILGAYKSAVLNIAPNSWFHLKDMTKSLLKFLITSMLCLLAIALNLDLAFPMLTFGFGWIIARTSLSQHQQSDWLHWATELTNHCPYCFHLVHMRAWRNAAEVPPENSTADFGTFLIREELTPAELAFLRGLRPLFYNLCLDINNRHVGDELAPQYQATIRQLAPLISSDCQQQQRIASIISNHQALQFLAADCPASKSILFSARLLCLWNYRYMKGQSELLADWLFTRRQDGQPRTLVGLAENGQPFHDFCARVRERFQDPARPVVACPFFVRLSTDFVAKPSAIENALTGEQLTIREVEHGGKYHWLMTNCSMVEGVDEELMARKTAELLAWNDNDDENVQQRCFFLDFSIIWY